MEIKIEKGVILSQYYNLWNIPLDGNFEDGAKEASLAGSEEMLGLEEGDLQVNNSQSACREFTEHMQAHVMNGKRRRMWICSHPPLFKSCLLDLVHVNSLFTISEHICMTPRAHLKIQNSNLQEFAPPFLCFPFSVWCLICLLPTLGQMESWG
jgi:hypothetical protein